MDVQLQLPWPGSFLPQRHHPAAREMYRLIPFASAVMDTGRDEEQNTKMLWGNEARVCFSICKEPPGLGTPEQAASEDWGRRDNLPAFFLPIPQAEGPSDLG